MAARTTANTGQKTFDGSTFFGVELIADVAYSPTNVIYTFTEQELRQLLDLLVFEKNRNITTETTATTFTDSV